MNQYAPIKLISACSFGFLGFYISDAKIRFFCLKELLPLSKQRLWSVLFYMLACLFRNISSVSLLYFLYAGIGVHLQHPENKTIDTYFQYNFEMPG